MKCPKCGGTIFSPDSCPRCGSLKVAVGPSIPGASAPAQHSPYASSVDIEARTKARKAFRRNYRIPLIAAAFYFSMDIYLNNMPEADHTVDEPWPFVFQMSRLLAFLAFVVTLIMRSQPPMLYFVWSVTVAIVVRIGAVWYLYGLGSINLIEWVWASVGLIVVASFWILKYGVHHRVRNW
jgi:hypothetical protein